MRFWRDVKVRFGFDFGVSTSAIWHRVVMSCRVRFWCRVEYSFGVLSSSALALGLASCRVRF